MSEYDRQIELIFIMFVIILGFYYVYLASNTQMLGEDEGGYMQLAKEFANLEYKVEPQGYVVFPLMPLMYSLSFQVFGYSLGVAKAVIALLGVLTLILIYLFCKKIDKTSFFGINVFGLASISILLTIFYFTHFMLIAYTEIPMAFFSILVVYVLMELKDIKGAVFVGAIMGLSFYVKSTTPIIFPMALFFFALLQYFLKKDKQFLKLAVIACLVSAAFMVPFLARNIYLYNLPYVEGLNSFFKSNVNVAPKWETPDITKSLSIPINPFDVFGYIALFLSIFGIVYLALEKNSKMLFTLFLFVLFISIFFIRNLLGTGISDPRYFSVIFPEIALLGGYFVGKASGMQKYLPIVLVMFLIFAVQFSIGVATSTEQSQRYPNDYVDGLKWLKQNTNKNDIIFTAYGGSLMYYGERNSIWARSIDEFPDIMHSTNSTYIYENLKKYNVSYILVWRGVLSSDWIIPQSNIVGVFTYNFVTQVDSDKEHFNMTYSNTNSQNQPDNFIFKLL